MLHQLFKLSILPAELLDCLCHHHMFFKHQIWPLSFSPGAHLHGMIKWPGIIVGWWFKHAHDGLPEVATQLWLQVSNQVLSIHWKMILILRKHGVFFTFLVTNCTPKRLLVSRYHSDYILFWWDYSCRTTNSNIIIKCKLHSSVFSLKKLDENQIKKTE